MRYFFNVQDGHYIPDTIGTVMTDMEAVRDEAVRTTAALLTGTRRAEFWAGEDWTMHVRDETDHEVLTLRFSALETHR